MKIWVFGCPRNVILDEKLLS